MFSRQAQMDISEARHDDDKDDDMRHFFLPVSTGFQLGCTIWLESHIVIILTDIVIQFMISMDD